MEARKTIEKIKELHDSSRLQFELNCSMLLAGSDKAKLRQEIIEEVTGEKLPASKCGLHKVSEVLQAKFNQVSLF